MYNLPPKKNTQRKWAKKIIIATQHAIKKFNPYFYFWMSYHKLYKSAFSCVLTLKYNVLSIWDGFLKGYPEIQNIKSKKYILLFSSLALLPSYLLTYS